MIKLPDYIRKVLDTLANNGFEAYIVGGCVRDSLLGVTPYDYDVTTNAKPDQIKQLFAKTFDTGIKHGTVTVVIDKNNIEVTTYRIEGVYRDGRHPDKVEFVTDLKEDLSRRDFTINAMAYNEADGLIDVFCGREDLKNKVIKSVGESVKRFEEDALRILRAFRFASKLDFDISEETLLGIQKTKSGLCNISQERIREELSKIVVAKHLDVFKTMFDTGVLEIVLPEFYECFHTGQNTKYHLYNVAEHTLKAMEESEPDYIVRWALLLHDIGKPKVKTTDESGTDHFKTHAYVSEKIAGEVLNRLKFSNRDKHSIKMLVKMHDSEATLSDYQLKKLLVYMGDADFEKLIEIKRADALAKNPEYAKERLDEVNRLYERYTRIKNSNEPIYLKDLAVDGNMLIELGYKGQQIGDILSYLHKTVLKDAQKNKYETLVECAMEYARKNNV